MEKVCGEKDESVEKRCLWALYSFGCMSKNVCDGVNSRMQLRLCESGDY